LRSKAIEAVEQADLDRLVKDGAQETDTAEFKQQMWGKSDDEKREMLKDIASFANYKGGEIYVGIREEDGVAVEVEGVEGEGHAERIHSSCRSNIDRSLRGLQVHPVPLENGRSVIIVRVPYSLGGPHMVTFKGLNQFWIRHGRQKAPMTVDEIEDAFMRRLDSETAVERFIEGRKQRARKEWPRDPLIFLAVTPVFLRDEIIDPHHDSVYKLLRWPPEQPNYQYRVLECDEPRASLAGMAAEVSDGARMITRLEAHRNGHVEFVRRTLGLASATSDDDRLGILAGLVALQTYSFLHVAVELYRQQGVVTPVVLSLSILNAASTRLVRGEAFLGHPSPRWMEDRLDIPAIYVQELQSEVGSALKRWNDRLWNAFRLPSCPYVTAEGDLANIR
jgi:hypothetical protein